MAQEIIRDIVPALYESIHNNSKDIVVADPWVKAFNKQLKGGKATQMDVAVYADHVGLAAGKALAKGLV